MLFNICVTAPIRPIITFTIDGTEYVYDGSDLDITGKLLFQNTGTRGWKMYVYDSFSMEFGFIGTTIDLCAVGHGGRGGAYDAGSGAYHYEYGGDGGNGGQVLNLLAQRYNPGDVFNFTVGDSTKVLLNGAELLAPTTGGGASGGREQIAYYNPEQSEIVQNGSNGSNGSYAFGDSTFDGIRYAPGGGGGGTSWGGWPSYSNGATSGSYGYGGHGGGGGNAGGKGVVIMRYTG